MANIQINRELREFLLIHYWVNDCEIGLENSNGFLNEILTNTDCARAMQNVRASALVPFL